MPAATRKILILQGHPDPKAQHFDDALADAYAKGAAEAGHEARTAAAANSGCTGCTPWAARLDRVSGGAPAAARAFAPQWQSQEPGRPRQPGNRQRVAACRSRRTSA
jgi:putative NADPH-quinone reductase